MGVISRITKAQDELYAANNLQDYLRTADSRQSKRRNGGSNPVNRPRKQLALRPFATGSGDRLILVQASEAAFTQMGSNFGNRIEDDANIIRTATVNKGITPAKLTLKIPESSTGSGGIYKQSKYTKLWYPYRKTTSYSLPFGALSANEDFLEAAQGLKSVIAGTVIQNKYASITISSEKVKT